MAVCSKCGSGVPKGESQCPKCGSIFIIYNEDPKPSSSASTSYNESPNHITNPNKYSVGEFDWKSKDLVDSNPQFEKMTQNLSTKEKDVDKSRISNFIPTGSLASQLKSLALNVDALERIMDEDESIRTKIKKPVKSEPISRARAMKPFLIPGCILCGVSLMFVGSEYTMGYFALLLIAGLIVIGIGYFASNGRIERSTTTTQEKYNAEVEEQKQLEKHLNEIEKQKDMLIDKIQHLMIYDGAEISIPDSYFYSDAIGYFADRIMSGRSNSLGEAMDAYDEHIHRLKLEQAAFESAEYQRQSANNLAAIQRENAALRRQGAINTALHVANTIRHWD